MRSGALALAALLVSACGSPPAPPAVATAAATYIGSDRCRACHTQRFGAWRKSHHAGALQKATAETVLGNFDGQSAFGARFEHAGGQFSVVDAGTRYPVVYTIGLAPLQQYLLDVGRGRLQALDIAWDVRHRRWFSINEPRPPASDVLHWRGRGYNWNSACADCHATAVHKGFDAATSSYDTRWHERAVGCEACHGPGSQHAEKPSAPYSRHLDTPRGEVEACAPCHARRLQIAEGHSPSQPLLDAYVPATITPPLYQLDGQIDDEVFEYGSFVQSRMYHAGVACSDCHDSHSGGLRAAGDALCLRCHNESPPARFPHLVGGRYQATEHHFHPQNSAGARCVACHMPPRFYMGIDERRDHGLRVPNPWLAARLGLREPCTTCHRDHRPDWAARELEARGVHERDDEVGALLARLARGKREVEERAARRAMDVDGPALVRATLLTWLDHYERGVSFAALRAAIADHAPQVRLAAASSERLLASTAWRRLVPLLSDPVLAVRSRAARTLQPRRDQLTPQARERFDHALQDYLATLELNADSPSAQTDLAEVQRQRGEVEGAESSLERALAIEPRWIPALINLADLQRATGRDELAGETLQRALRADPDSADAHFAYGLWCVRAGHDDEALLHLSRAVALAPDRPRFAYVLAIGQAEAGDLRGAIATLEHTSARNGKSREIALALATYRRDAGDIAAAHREAAALVSRFPSDGAARALLRELSESADRSRDAPPSIGSPPTSP